MNKSALTRKVIVRYFEPHPYAKSPWGYASGYKWFWRRFQFVRWVDVVVGYAYPSCEDCVHLGPMPGLLCCRDIKLEERVE